MNYIYTSSENYRRRKLIEKLLNESMSYGFLSSSISPSKRRAKSNPSYDPSDARFRPGGAILRLTDEERKLLAEATAADFTHRLDHCAMMGAYCTPHSYDPWYVPRS